MAGNKQHIIHGLRDGIPIAMGYFAVTFSLGIIAAKAGLTAPLGFLSSFFTRASAGECGTSDFFSASRDVKYFFEEIGKKYVFILLFCSLLRNFATVN